MKPFLNEDFLLATPTARRLYHGIAENLPIIDYHCHLNPEQIEQDKRFATITEAWLYGDHYKWRAMRACGFEEALVTGPGDDYERFQAWAATVQRAVGNPLFHWTHLELQRCFGIHDVLTSASAPDVWQRANERLTHSSMSARGLMRRFRVEVVCTTDDPADSLRSHKAIADEGALNCKVLPAWRPDRALTIERADFPAYIAALGAAAGVDIADWDSLTRALALRMDHFAAHGCSLSDHGFTRLPFSACADEDADAALKAALGGQTISEAQADGYKTRLMIWLGREYARRGWAMQLHISASRNNNSARFAALGPDTGYDAIADHAVAAPLQGLLDTLERDGSLPRTILYSLNPKDNYVLAALAGCFSEAGVEGKVQLGSAWWYLDHIEGMERQLRDLANVSLLSPFVGMLTDSRSFLSYPRHEYFRRILCNLIGNWVENGECPDDDAILEPLVRGICCDNARKYFKL